MAHVYLTYIHQEEEIRKQEAVKRQAMAGNTKEAHQKLAQLTSGPASVTKHLAHVSGTNAAMKQPTKSHASSLYEKVCTIVCICVHVCVRTRFAHVHGTKALGIYVDLKNALERVGTWRLR
jgi:hypothetical protein